MVGQTESDGRPGRWSEQNTGAPRAADAEPTRKHSLLVLEDDADKVEAEAAARQLCRLQKPADLTAHARTTLSK